MVTGSHRGAPAAQVTVRKMVELAMTPQPPTVSSREELPCHSTAGGRGGKFLHPEHHHNDIVTSQELAHTGRSTCAHAACAQAQQGAHAGRTNATISPCRLTSELHGLRNGRPAGGGLKLHLPSKGLSPCLVEFKPVCGRKRQEGEEAQDTSPDGFCSQLEMTRVGGGRTHAASSGAPPFPFVLSRQRCRRR